MKRSELSGGGSVGVGISSVLMIFVALCLTIFSVLSYLSARADVKLAQRTAAAVSAYYAADLEAEHILGRLAGAGAGLEEEAAALGVTLSAGPGGTAASYQIPVDEKRTLSVELLLEGGGVTRRVWKVTTENAEADEHISVLQDFSFLN